MLIKKTQRLIAALVLVGFVGSTGLSITAEASSHYSDNAQEQRIEQQKEHERIDIEKKYKKRNSKKKNAEFNNKKKNAEFNNKRKNVEFNSKRKIVGFKSKRKHAESMMKGIILKVIVIQET